MKEATNHRHASLNRQETYSSLDVSNLTGVSLRQLQWWDEQGVVSPIQKGHRRMYQLHEVVEVGLITELRRKGVSLQKIRKVLRFLKEEMGAEFLSAVQDGNEVHLLTDGEKLYLEDSHKSIVDILKNADQPIIGVCISDQVERLSTTVKPKKGVKTERQASAPQAKQRKGASRAS